MNTGSASCTPTPGPVEICELANTGTGVRENKMPIETIGWHRCELEVEGGNDYREAIASEQSYFSPWSQFFSMKKAVLWTEKDVTKAVSKEEDTHAADRSNPRTVLK